MISIYDPKNRLQVAVLLALLLFIAMPQAALGSDSLAKEIEQILICPACTDTGMTVDYCPDGVAAGIRDQVEQKLAMGLTKDQIVNDHVAQYGIALLAKPQKSGSGLLAWVMPFVGVAVGGALVYVLLKRRNTSPNKVPNSRTNSTTLEDEYNNKLDSEIKRYI